MDRIEAVGILVLAKERENDKPEHVKGRHARNAERQNGDEHVPRQLAEGKRSRKEFIFTKEPGRQRHAGNGERIDEERPERDRHLRPKAAHVPDILRIGVVIVGMVERMVHGMND